MTVKVEKEIAGRTLTIETGRVARQANGATMVRYGDTQVFTAVTSSSARFGMNFFPLTVDYREKTTAAGKFPGGFIKREGRPTTKEILTCRLIDRPIRPMFPDSYTKNPAVADTSVAAMVLSVDQENDPDVLAGISASAALSVSDLPFLGPLGTVRIGLIEEEIIVFPTHEQLKESKLDLVVAGTMDAVTMVECGAKEVSEEKMVEAIAKAHEVIREIVEMQNELAEKVGKPKMELEDLPDNSEQKAELKVKYFEGFREKLLTEGKHARSSAVSEYISACQDEVSPEPEEGAEADASLPDRDLVKSLLRDLADESERELILSGTRTDGRSYTDIRDINAEVGVLPNRVHGSSLFTRGETQSLVSVALGTGKDQQIVDGLGEEYKERFTLHYNFPAFSVGESWPNRGPKRREIGHGMLAQRALANVMPTEEDFPYTVRIISDIMESNGSSSMASVCGGALGLMDAGVNIRQPVAGIAMGLVKDGDKTAILSDILGSEDHNGDMDFKVAGTQFGITALQMDIKITGVSQELLAEALEQARGGRIHILKEMLKALGKPRDDISPFAPRIIQIRIDPEKIGLIIGPGGKMIKSIQEETGTTIEIENDGVVTIWSTDMEGAKGAQQKIEALTEEVQADRIYDGKVVSIKDFGCFVEVLPGQEGLVHVSELADGFVDKVGDLVSIGDIIKVMCLGTDNQGRIKLSKKAAEGGGDGDGDSKPPPKERSREGGGDRRGGRGGGDRRGGRGGGDRGGRGSRERGSGGNRESS
ncbi:MAG: polyribonucleotide nucleotidyltransferase [Planctomycetota bacterium]|nr:polyribonucleotide nucleotidyltransferase [Planctomycetota bacterium]MEE3055289.1 polyribonucleotide nucleotidyltransferase [Planctomycetota bacterium]